MKPNYEVDLNYETYDSSKPETDNQLQKAIEVIVK